MFAGARDFADAIFQQGRRVVRQKVALVIDEEHFGVGEKWFVFPRALKLRDFFFERHAREEIGDALFDGEICVAIGRRCDCCCGDCVCALATRDFNAKVPAIANTTPTHAQNRKKKRTKTSIEYFYACNPKSAWYDTTTVNVHGKGFLQIIFDVAAAPGRACLEFCGLRWSDLCPRESERESLRVPDPNHIGMPFVGSHRSELCPATSSESTLEPAELAR